MTLKIIGHVPLTLLYSKLIYNKYNATVSISRKERQNAVLNRM